MQICTRCAAVYDKQIALDMQLRTTNRCALGVQLYVTTRCAQDVQLCTTYRCAQGVQPRVNTTPVTKPMLHVWCNSSDAFSSTLPQHLK